MAKTLEYVEHNGYGARREVFNIDEINNEDCTIRVSSSYYPTKVITFADRKKFEQLIRCGYTFVACWGDVNEYIIKN